MFCHFSIAVEDWNLKVHLMWWHCTEQATSTTYRCLLLDELQKLCLLKYFTRETHLLTCWPSLKSRINFPSWFTSSIFTSPVALPTKPIVCELNIVYVKKRHSKTTSLWKHTFSLPKSALNECPCSIKNWNKYDSTSLCYVV